MSLLKNVHVRALWDAVQHRPEERNTARNFWEYVLSKDYFTESNYFITSHWTPTSPQLLWDLYGTERLNFVVKAIGALNPASISLVCVVECGTRYDLPIVIEAQALDACAQHLAISGLSWVYAMTTVGTAAMLWKYVPRAGTQPKLEPLIHPPTYFEADQPDMLLLGNWFDRMKGNPPT
ncbi:hypothetical protein MMC22_005462 [Lobaria immixta]|nr:hypothetical protein [Lobaria immixta]